MTYSRALVTLALCAAFHAHAGDSPLNALARTQEVCVKYPTPQARAECVQKQKQTDSALARERAQAEKADQPSLGGSAPKKNDLCFTRKSTGEVVCPN